MAYRLAHRFILLLLPLTAFAFWPNYFSDLSGAALALHIHAITATLWILVVAVQSWSIHRRHRDLHRAVGASSLLLFPFFIAGSLLVVQSMAQKFVGDHPFYTVFGARLAALDLGSTLAQAYLVYCALRWRRLVRTHAAAMLATLTFLLPPILGRLAPLLPPLAIQGPADLHRFAYGLHFSHVLVAVGALLLYRRDPDHAWPFGLVALIVALQSLLFETLGRTHLWEETLAYVAVLPIGVTLAFGLTLGGTAVVAGWHRVPVMRGRVLAT